MYRSKQKRRVLVAVIALGVPLLTTSRDGPYAMYARTVTYHLEVTGLDREGHRHAFNPAGLAKHVSSDVGAFLVGADHDRAVPQIDALRWHLDDIAALACAEHRTMTRAEVALFERRDEEPVELQTEEHGTASCNQ